MTIRDLDAAPHEGDDVLDHGVVGVEVVSVCVEGPVCVKGDELQVRCRAVDLRDVEDVADLGKVWADVLAAADWRRTRRTPERPS